MMEDNLQQLATDQETEKSARPTVEDFAPRRYSRSASVKDGSKVGTHRRRHTCAALDGRYVDSTL